MKKPKIIFMGTPEFAVPALALLLKQNYPIVGVVTQPDRPQGRGRVLLSSPVKDLALANCLPIMQPESVQKAVFLETFQRLSPDILVLAAYGQLLPVEIIKQPKIPCLNIHPSLLPKYRGAAPINWAIICGEKTTGVTIMRMAEGLDAGEIILQEEVSIGADENFDSLHDRLSMHGANLLISAIEKTINGTAESFPQDAAKATYAPRLKKENCLIRWEHRAQDIVNLIRGLSSHPGAYTLTDGKKLKIFSATAEGTVPKEAPGTALIKDKYIAVAASDGFVHLQDIQMENKKRMSVENFLRGYQFKNNTILG